MHSRAFLEGLISIIFVYLLFWEVYDSASLDIYELLLVCFSFSLFFCVGMERTKKAETMLTVSESDDSESSVLATTKQRRKRLISDLLGSSCDSRKKPKKASVGLFDKYFVSGTKRQPIEKDEQVAVKSTTGENIPRPNRRLTNFVFYDSNGRPQPIEMLEICNMYVAGTILPLEGSSDEEKEKGIRCEHFGRLESWAISGFEEGSPVIWVSTKIADYECIEPRTGYKRIYKNFYEKARACIEVYKRLSNSCGGNPNVSLDELVAGVVSSMAQGRKFLSGLTVENFVISQGDFIHDQLIGLDETCKQNDNVFCDLPVLAALRDKKRESKGSLPGKATAAGRVPKQSLRICDKEKKNETKGKVISATTTKLVNRIWGEFYSNYLPEKLEGGRGFKVNEDEETLLLEKIKKHYSVVKPTKFCSSNKEITWDGQPGDKTCAGETLYKRAIVRGDAVAVGSSVLVEMDDSDDVSPIYFVEYMFENSDGRKMVHGRLMLRGLQTVLGTSANEREVFLTNDCLVFDLGDVKQTVVMDIRLTPWGYQHRKTNANNEKIDRARAEERRRRGLPLEYYCRSLYWPERGAFFCLSTNTMGLGSGVCQSCKMKETQKEKEIFKVNKSKTTFSLKGAEYSVKDFVYLRPHYFPADGKAMDTSKGRKNTRLKPFVVCHLLEIKLSKSYMLADPESTKVKVRRFFRPDDISPEKAHLSDVREVRTYFLSLQGTPISRIIGVASSMYGTTCI